jgi:hypothetical protein
MSANTTISNETTSMKMIIYRRLWSSYALGPSGAYKYMIWCGSYLLAVLWDIFYEIMYSSKTDRGKAGGKHGKTDLLDKEVHSS